MRTWTISCRKPASPDVGYVRLNRSDVHRGHLLLVNPANPVRLDTPDIVPLPAGIRRSANAEEREIALERTCMRQLSALLDACEAKDRIAVVSGYRSKASQQRIYNQSLSEHGESFTASYVALPGASEHQTGLAVDVGLCGQELDYIRPAFSGDGVSARFRELAPEFGFIQRYQEGKVAVTGIACEPWHFRYVGFPHSSIMDKFGLCLEEYAELLKRYRHGVSHLLFETKDSKFEIYYAEANDYATDVPIADDGSAAWSGNNRDGYIITLSSAKGGTNRDT